MKFHDASHHLLKAQEKLLRAARKGEVLAQKAERRPGHMAKKTIAKSADVLVAEPAKMLAKATLVGTKELAKTGAWAMKATLRGAVAGSKGAAHAIDGLGHVDVASARIMSDKPAASVYAEQINLLQDGLSAALARADFLTKNPPSIQLDVGQYLKLSGIIAAEKIPKMMLMSAAVHSFGLGATAIGHFLTPGIEESALHAVGMGNAAAQTGVGVGLVHALHSPMTEALRKSNIVQKDQEWSNYTTELNQARSDLKAVTKALMAIQKIDEATKTDDAARVRKSLVQTVERGLRVASASVEEMANGGRASQLDDTIQLGHSQAAADFVLSLGIAAGDIGQSAAQLVSLANKTTPAQSIRSSSSSTLVNTDAGSRKSWSESTQRIEFLRAKREHFKLVNDCDKRIANLNLRREQLEAVLLKRPDDGALKSDISRLDLRLVAEHARRKFIDENGRSNSEHRMNKADDILAAERLAMRHAASALDTDMAASLAKQYESRHSHYNDRYMAQRSRFERKMARLEQQLQAKNDIQIEKKLEAQKQRYEAKLAIIAKKGTLASLDAEFAEHLAQPKSTPNDSASIANRRRYLTVLRSLEADRANALAQGDVQKRTSLYVTPQAQMASSSPALVRGIAETGRFLFGVIPGINLPWWSFRWGSKQLAARRLEATVQRVTSPVTQVTAGVARFEESLASSRASSVVSPANQSSALETESNYSTAVSQLAI